MSKLFKSLMMLVCGLVAFLIVQPASAVPTAHANVRIGQIPFSGGGGPGPIYECPAPIPAYGVSYDADSFSMLQGRYLHVNIDGDFYPTALFGFTYKDGPSVGVFGCVPYEAILLWTQVAHDDIGWYNLVVTVNNQTTQAVLQPDAVDTDITTTRQYYMKYLSIDMNQHYSYQVQHCLSFQMTPICTDLSPNVQLATFPTHECISGYVWREASPSDQVCVTPQERDQVAYDNSQADNRIDTSTVSGALKCIRGYSMRTAFGGDDVCVTVAQRKQVALDNSLAASRIVVP